MVDDCQVPNIPKFGFDMYGTRACSLETVIPKLGRKNVYQLLLPRYPAEDARLERTPQDLRGHVVIFQNLSEAFERLRHAERVRQYYREFDVASAASARP